MGRLIKYNLVSFFLIVAFFHAKDSTAQYEIKLSIDGMTDSLYYLAHFNGDTFLVKDTIVLKEQESIVFEGDSMLPQGVYLLVNSSKRRVFDFIIGEDQNFSISGDSATLPMHIRVKGSVENSAFFDYIQFISGMSEEINPLRQKLTGNELSENQKSALQQQINSINQKVTNFQHQFFNKHTGLFSAKFLEAGGEIKIPDSILFNKIKVRPYYVMHFWDNFDLSDDRMLRTPIFQQKLNQYFDQIVNPHPDSICSACDRVISLASNSVEIQKYLLWELLVKYQKSDIMGYDAIYVYLADKYFKTTPPLWLSESTKKTIQQQADIHRPLLIGKIAPNILAMDTTGHNVEALFGVDAQYTLLLFWESHCFHCKQEIPKIADLVRDYGKLYDIKIFAVGTDTSEIIWKQTIEKMGYSWIHVNGNQALTTDYHKLYNIYSTPVVFVLDREKRIIAKRILSDQILSLLKNRHQDITPM